MRDNHFYKELLEIKTEEFNPNPKNDVNDCFIRAMCKLLNKTWDEVYSEIVTIGFEEKAMYNSVKLNRKYLRKFGFTIREFEYRSVTIGQFMYEHKIGKYLIGDQFHIIAYIDGVIYDKQKCLINIDEYLTSYAAYIFTDHEMDDKYLHKYEDEEEDKLMDDKFRMEIGSGSENVVFYDTFDKLLEDVENKYGEKTKEEVKRWASQSKEDEKYHKYDMTITNIGKI